MASFEVAEFTRSGNSITKLLRAAAPSVPGINALPGIRKASNKGFTGLKVGLQRSAVSIDSAAVDSYAAICGFERRESIPLTYPHMLAFDLHMALMSDPAFPWPAMGTVHVENTVTSHRPILRSEILDVAATVSGVRPHRQGLLFDFVTEVFSAGELVWQEVSTNLRRGKRSDTAPPGLEFASVPTATTTWELPSDLGRRYGAVSGDVNPIHLTPLTAKALGFKRHIAHGMWSKARCLAALENRLPDAVRVEVAFKKPIFLPATVGFGFEPTAGAPRHTPPDLTFALSRPHDGAPHLIGRTESLETDPS